MGIITVTDELISSISAPRMFKAIALDCDNLIPKIAPHYFKSIETIHGNGGPGSIKKLTYPGSEVKFVKSRIDALDKENMIFAYTYIESEPINDQFESISYEIKLEPTPDGGCKSKRTTNYNTKPGVEIKEEIIKSDQEATALIFKGVEAYLLANPHEYV